MTVQTPVRVLALLPGIMPSTLMDVIKPMLALQRRGLVRFRMALEIYPLPSLQVVDAAIFCRNMEPRYQALDQVLERGIPCIYDLDDNFFEIPEDIPEEVYRRSEKHVEQLSRYIRSAHLVRVYSPVLYEQLQPLTERVELVKAPLDWDVIDHQPEKPGEKSANRRVRIIYATSRRSDHLYQIFAPALQRLLAEFPEQVEMCFWGIRPPEFAGLPQVQCRPYQVNYDHFMRQFARAGFEIGLAPLPDEIFYRSKTENKFREYAACGIAGIYSKVDVYERVVTHGLEGLLVENSPEAWYASLKRLVEDPALRWQMGLAAREKAQAIFEPGQFEALWWEQLTQVIRPARPVSSPQVSRPAEAAAGTPEAGSPRLGPRLKSVLRRGDPGQILFAASFHLRNLWWLIKVNWLKRI